MRCSRPPRSRTAPTENNPCCPAVSARSRAHRMERRTPGQPKVLRSASYPVRSTWACTVSRSSRHVSTGPSRSNFSTARTARSNAAHTIAREWVKCRSRPRISHRPRSRCVQVRASSLTRVVTTASHVADCRSASSAPARSATPGCTRSSAAATCRQNRAASLSPSSSDSQATGRWPPRTQSPSRLVLPKPAGVQTRTSSHAIPSAMRASSRGRGTNPVRGRGTCSLVASSASRAGPAAPGRVVVGGSAIGTPHPHPSGEAVSAGSL